MGRDRRQAERRDEYEKLGREMLDQVCCMVACGFICACEFDEFDLSRGLATYPSRIFGVSIHLKLCLA